MLGNVAMYLGAADIARHIALQDGEAAKLERALTDFAAHHDIQALGPKRQSELNLILALGAIYGRIGVAVVTHGRQGTNAVANTPVIYNDGNVVPMAAAGNAPPSWFEPGA
jgi:hypothetical protein